MGMPQLRYQLVAINYYIRHYTKQELTLPAAYQMIHIFACRKNHGKLRWKISYVWALSNSICID